MNLADVYVIKGADGVIADYVFVDPTITSHYPIPDRTAFEYAVSFSITSALDRNYPVVFDDLTTSDGRRLEAITYVDVPAPVKRRLVAWLKLQPPPAAGPAGPPAKPLTSSADGSGTKPTTSSDRIKDAIVLRHPDTRAADWKRRTRTKGPDGTSRNFEHVDGRMVRTMETTNGTIVIHPDGAAIKIDPPA